MGEKESLIRARYAVSVLRVAKGSPVKDALKLVEGLSRDWLDMESDGKIAQARTDFLHTCQDLAEALRTGSPAVPMAWDKATHAAASWLALLQKQ